jgi:hypothetical protein
VKARSLFAALSIVALAFPLAGSANNPIVSAATHTYSQNMKPVAESPRPNPAPGVFNSDLAFWERTAYQGTYDGFRIIDISASGANVILNYDQCFGN